MLAQYAKLTENTKRANLEKKGTIIFPWQMIEFPTDGGKCAYMLYYPPRNSKFEAPEGEKPPLIVKIHGGPTGAGRWHGCLL